MRKEVIDPNSGAILFKRTNDGKKLDSALEKIEKLEKRIKDLEKRVKGLEK